MIREREEKILWWFVVVCVIAVLGLIIIRDVL